MLFACASPVETNLVLEVRRIDFSFRSLEGDDDFVLDIDPVESRFMGLPVASIASSLSKVTGDSRDKLEVLNGERALFRVSLSVLLSSEVGEHLKLYSSAVELHSISVWVAVSTDMERNFLEIASGLVVECKSATCKPTSDSGISCSLLRLEVRCSQCV